jgi:drug/metabolite transporter (DMT)-like permease
VSALQFQQKATPAELGHRGVITAILVMLLAGLCSSLLHIGVRYVSPTMPATEIVFIRSTITILFTLPIVLRSTDVAWRTTRPALQIFRGLIGVFSMTLWYYALAHMPLAEAGALSFTTGLFVTLGAALCFGEVVGIRRWSAVTVGFIGALVVLRPGADMLLSWPAIAAVVSSALWAASLLLVKALARYDTTLTISFYQPLLIAPFAMVAALPVWVWPDARAWTIMAGMGAVAAVGNYCYIYALRIADASLVMPADYVRLVWMAGWGFLFFAEIPLLTTWVGAVLIIGATSFITVRESQGAAERRRAQARAAFHDVKGA